MSFTAFVDRTKIKVLLILISFFLLVPLSYGEQAFAAQASPAVQMLAISLENQNIILESYSITIPNFPNITSQAGYEFHSGLLSDDNQTFMKTTISYGCEIAAHKACFPPFLNRYVFYVSIINQTDHSRVQTPPQGYPVTMNSKYMITLKQTKPCISQTSNSWTFSISNKTSTFTRKICTGNIPLSFNKIEAGLLEIHNVTSCAEFPSQNKVAQDGLKVLGQNNLPLVPNWKTFYNPSINCNFHITFSNNDLDVQENWNS